MAETTLKNHKPPTHRAYTMPQGETAAGISWIEIGTVETHQDGKGCDIQLHALPCSGRIVIRPGPPDLTAAAGHLRPFF